MSGLHRIAVFCGSSSGKHPEFTELAGALGHRLATDGIGLVYGGASIGLMGAVADGALAAGGEVIGVLPGLLGDGEVGHDSLTQFHEVDDMHERKALMYRLSDAFIALPGGIGTLEELFEVATWSKIGHHHDGRRKPSVLLDVLGFWEPMHQFLDHLTGVGFVKARDRSLIGYADSVDGALEVLRTAQEAHP